MKRIYYESIASTSDEEWSINAITMCGGNRILRLSRRECALIEDKNLAFVPRIFLHQQEATLNVKFKEFVA